MVVLGGHMGVGSGHLGGWLCTRRGELEIGPDLEPSGALWRTPCAPLTSHPSAHYGEKAREERAGHALSLVFYNIL